MFTFLGTFTLSHKKILSKLTRNSTIFPNKPTLSAMGAQFDAEFVLELGVLHVDVVQHVSTNGTA
jgi:hypothetical protein